MDDSGHRPASSPRSGDHELATPSTVEQDSREAATHGAEVLGASTAKRHSEGFDFVRDAIHRSYR